MDTWVHQQLRATYRRRVIAWSVILGCAVLFALAQSRYIKNLISGPFDVGQLELDAIGDVSTTPQYFVRVTGSKGDRDRDPADDDAEARGCREPFGIRRVLRPSGR